MRTSVRFWKHGLARWLGSFLLASKKFCLFSSFSATNYLKKIISLGVALLIAVLLPIQNHSVSGGNPALNFAERFAERTFAASSCFFCGTLLSVFLCQPTHAQDAAEAAGATTYSATAPFSMKSPKPPSAPAPASKPAPSPHLFATSTVPPEETNRAVLEQKAGTEACKLLVRSTLPGSRVWINGKPVGKAPMLLVVPPGKYLVEVEGPRAERNQSVVALLPRETRELAVKLAERYPTRVTLH